MLIVWHSDAPASRARKRSKRDLVDRVINPLPLVQFCVSFSFSFSFSVLICLFVVTSHSVSLADHRRIDRNRRPARALPVCVARRALVAREHQLGAGGIRTRRRLQRAAAERGDDFSSESDDGARRRSR